LPRPPSAGACTAAPTLAICAPGPGLAVALAAILDAFAVRELWSHGRRQRIDTALLAPLILLYLLLPRAARVYADLPAGTATLLLIAPVTGRFPPYAVACPTAETALTRLLVTADSASGYLEPVSAKRFRVPRQGVGHR